MADLSWINPLFEKARGAFGLDPKQAAEGQLIQKHGDLYTAQTETEKYRLSHLLPAQKGVFDADAGLKKGQTEKVGAETIGIGLKNKGAQQMADFLADNSNYITAPDGRRVPDPVKLNALFSAASLSAGDKTIQHLPGFVGGMNLQANPLSPGANLAAGGTNATAGANMLKPIQLNPDQTLIQKDPLTGQPITGAPMANPQVTLPSMAGPLTNLPANAEVLKAGSFDPKALAEILTASNKASMDRVGISMPGKAASNLPYTAPASSTKLQIADANNDTEITKVEKQIEAKIAIALQNGASREEVARIRNEGSEAVARIRGKGRGSSSAGTAAAGNEEGGVAPIDLNRLGDREKAAAEYLVNSFGKKGHDIDPNQAALLAAAATQSFPNDPAGVAVQKFMTQNRITSGTGGWSRVDFTQDGKPMDFEALRTKLFGAQPGPAAAATGAPTTPIAAEGAPAAGAAPAGPPSKLAETLSGGQGAPKTVPGLGVLAPAEYDKRVAAANSFKSGGMTFTDGIAKVPELKHGEQRLAKPKDGDINAAPIPLYYNADTGQMQEEKPGEQFSGNYRSSFWSGTNGPEQKLYAAFGNYVNNGYDSQGSLRQFITTAEGLGHFDQKVYDGLKTKEEKLNYLGKALDESLASIRLEYLGDPRIDQYAKGDFGEVGIPADAMRLAERLGINRDAFRIPQKGVGETLGGLGAVLAPAGYGPAQESMLKNLPAFFKAVQDGTFDPRTLTINKDNKAGVTNRVIAGTPVYQQSPHDVAAIKRGINNYNMPTLEDAIRERLGKSKPKQETSTRKPTRAEQI